ncbi:MAG TPA: crosslink repair DNA glycosylase YcaQ family protein [Gaiellaceae bacterium]|nr:crosslink repair DNA glycosylase YcaQ family protein [Gaiellaceae bacterium]
MPSPGRLRLTRQQILAFRRRVGGLDARTPKSAGSLRHAAWAGLQDSMPRAALLSLHARIDGVGPLTWDDPSMTDGEVARALGVGNRIRYAATTGTIAIRWEGARAPVIWAVDPPAIEPAAACRELARRHLRVFGPTTAVGFARWAGISRSAAAGAHAALEGSLLPVRTPLGDEWLLADDEQEMRAAETAPATARLLPSGDAYFLLDGKERELLVPHADRRALLWTSRVWPGALLVEGEIRGTWRRAQHAVRIETWTRLSRAARDAVEAEAAALPLPGLGRRIEVAWST